MDENENWKLAEQEWREEWIGNRIEIGAAFGKREAALRAALDDAATKEGG